MFAASILILALLGQVNTDPPVPAPDPPVVTNPRPARPGLARSPLTVEAVNSASFTKDLKAKSTGAEVLSIEILLDRAKFSPGEIDGIFGNNLAHAVIAYRRAHNLPLDPVVDQTVWTLLHADPGPLFVDYTIAREDVSGPFVSVPAGMGAKASLKRLGYESPAELLGEKFHLNPHLLAELNSDKALDTKQTVIAVPNVLTPAPPKPASLCVNGTDLTLQGLDATGHILMSYPVSVGSSHDPLPVGQWQIAAIHPYPVYSYDSVHFWDSSGPRARARIAPGPNNPVGVVWIGLTKNHYGIHGTPSPGLIGRGQSHGCIRMTNWDAAELASVVAPNLNVVLKPE